MGAVTGVYPVFNNVFKIGADKNSAKTVADMESFSVAIDGNVEEWTPMEQEGWVRRLKTGCGWMQETCLIIWAASKKIQSIFSGVWDKITSAFSNAKDVFKEKFDAAVTGIKDAFSGIKVSVNLIEFYGYLSFCAGSLFWISGNTNYQGTKGMTVNPEFALNLYDQAFE